MYLISIDRDLFQHEHESLACWQRLMLIIPLVLWGWVIPDLQSLAGETSATSEPIEVLEVIEVTGMAVTTSARTFSFPLPTFTHIPFSPTAPFLTFPNLHMTTPPSKSPPRLLIDRIGERRGGFVRVKLLKSERPLYPRMAREQGWQGKVVLRAQVTAEGSVDHVTVQESSGFPVLDDSAIQAVTIWSFEPAKNGEFPVASIVDLPIRFDLLQ